MATECRKQKRIDKRKLTECVAFGLLITSTAIGFGLGRITTPPETIVKTEIVTEKVPNIVTITETVTETVEVPKYVELLPTPADVFIYDVPLSEQIQRYIYRLCDDYEIPVSLVLAIIEQESNFDIEAVSDTDDYGLMQINKCNHGWLRKQGVTDVLDPYQNVRGGIIILSQCYNGNMSKALMQYNLGAGGASELWDEGVYSTYYSRLVLSTKEVYDAQV